MELGVTREGAAGEVVVALDVEPRFMGGKKSLDDFSTACQRLAFFPLMTEKVNFASVVLTTARCKNFFDGSSGFYGVETLGDAARTRPPGHCR